MPPIPPSSPQPPCHKPRIVLACGGSAGHVHPALSLAEELRKRGHHVQWITDPRGYHLLSGQAEPPKSTRVLPVRGLKGPWGTRIVTVIGWLHSTGRLLAHWCRSAHRPHIVVAFGGHTSIAPVLTAYLLRIPALLHEQNVVCGRANRWLGRLVRIIHAWPQLQPSFPGMIHISMPLPDRIVRLAQTTNAHTIPRAHNHHPTAQPLPDRTVHSAHTTNAHTTPRAHNHHPTAQPLPDRTVHSAHTTNAHTTPRAHNHHPTAQPLHLLVTGGTAAAMALTEAVLRALPLLDPSIRAHLYLTHQAHPSQHDHILEQTRKLNLVPPILSDFFADLPERMIRADLVIARAGAMTLAEITAFGVPAIVWPLISHDEHQSFNAHLCAQMTPVHLIDAHATTDQAASIIARCLTGHVLGSDFERQQRTTSHRLTMRLDGATEMANLVLRSMRTPDDSNEAQEGQA